MPNVYRVDPLSPDPQVIRHAARVLRSGGVVCYPTSGLYGLGAVWNDTSAVARIYAIKGRDRFKPILILIPDRSVLGELVAEIPYAAIRLMDRFWPGGMTLVFSAARMVPNILTAGTGKIGIRLPAHPVAQALLQAVGVPLTGTSANVSGQAGCDRVSDLAPAIRSSVDLVLDAGRLAGGSGSTVVDVTMDPVKVLRWGTVSMNQFREVIERWQ